MNQLSLQNGQLEILQLAMQYIVANHTFLFLTWLFILGCSIMSPIMAYHYALNQKREFLTGAALFAIVPIQAVTEHLILGT